MEVSNQSELDKYLENVMTSALDSTLDILLDKLKDIIDKDVYGWKSRSSNPWEPNRTFEFRDSWEKRKIQRTKTLIKGEISQRIATMKYHNVDGVKIHQDRKELTNIIANNIFDGYQFGDVSIDNPKKPFWSEFVKYCESNIEAIFVQECSKLGVELE